MSKRWWFAIVISIVVGSGALTLGAVVPRVGSYWGSFLTSVAPSAFVLAVVIWLIEGPLLTQERRRQRIISRNAGAVLKLVGEISWTMARETAEWLASEINSDIDLYGEERGDYTKFRPLVVQVFNEAVGLSVSDLPGYSNSMNREYYSSLVGGFQHFSGRVRERIRGNYEIQAVLVEIIDALDDLDKDITTALYPSILRDQTSQYQALGNLGNRLLNFEAGLCTKRRREIRAGGNPSITELGHL